MNEEQNIQEKPARARTKVKQESAPDVLPTQEAVLDNLERGAKYCQELQHQLDKYASPELDIIMRLHRMIILKLSAQADIQPKLWDVVKDLMKPVMDWARLQEQHREQELAERKYQDQVEAQKVEADKENKEAPGALTPETLEEIELELKLL